MDTYLRRFAYCYRNRLSILPSWWKMEICSIQDNGELKIQNKAQCHSPRPIPNDWRYFRPTLVFTVGFPYLRTLLQEGTVFSDYRSKLVLLSARGLPWGYTKAPAFRRQSFFQLPAAKKSRRIWEAWGLVNTTKTWELPTPHFKSFHLPRTFRRQSNELHIFFYWLRFKSILFMQQLVVLIY